ncbi:TOMM precursor leader peptide-binding protein [Brevibacillus thermoruber]|jgi:bacteriocin biosynthesis cyclodehydratase domain-containing protein|uniref:TOMM precursor leader peptide-binding protein n=1 Tax=Brevibacillus thermoruber TaxID=33942 RepID=UPI00054DDCD4|nr:TOMM precursor leader peptide-binding protein [Brevibacillus thermoruber]
MIGILVKDNRDLATQLANHYRQFNLSARVIDTLEECRSEMDLLVVVNAGTIGSEINRFMRKEAKCWLHVQWDRGRVLVGPVFHPSEGPCFECMSLRMKANMVEETERPEIPDSLEENMRRMMCDVVALETYKLVYKDHSVGAAYIADQMLEIDFLTFEGELYPVLRVPTCSVCGVETRIHQYVQPWMTRFSEVGT